MPSKLLVLGLVLSVLASVGCTGVFVPKEQYDRDVNQLKEYVAALERDNAELRPMKMAYDDLVANGKINGEADQAYAAIAESLKNALAGLGVDQKDFYYDPTTKSFVMGADVLFDSGKFDITAKGKEVLKKFAEVNRNSYLKIVGHTDPVKVSKASTVAALFTDTNTELSALRASSVAKELMKAGIPEGHMWVEGRGSSQPRPGGNKACRRVEIFLVGQNGKTSNK